MFGLFMNFSRLTDKALREYAAARAELLDYVSPHDGELRISPYLRAIDHMANCVGAAARAVLNAKALRDHKIGRSGPRLTAPLRVPVPAFLVRAGSRRRIPRNGGSRRRLAPHGRGR